MSKQLPRTSQSNEDFEFKRVLSRRPSSLARVSSLLNQITEETAERRHTREEEDGAEVNRKRTASDLEESRARSASSSAPALNVGSKPRGKSAESSNREGAALPTIFQRRLTARREESNKIPPFVAGSRRTDSKKPPRPSTATGRASQKMTTESTKERDDFHETQSSSEDVGYRVSTAIPSWLQNHDVFSSVEVTPDMLRRGESNTSMGAQRTRRTDDAQVRLQRARSSSGSSMSLARSMYRKSFIDKGGGGLKQKPSFAHSRGKSSDKTAEGHSEHTEKKSEVFQISAAHAHRLNYLEKSVKYDHSENNLQELLILRARTYGLDDSRTAEAKELLMKCYLAQNNIADASALQSNFDSHFAILEDKIVTLKGDNDLEQRTKQLNDTEEQSEPLTGRDKDENPFSISDEDRRRAFDFYVRARRFYRKGHFVPAAFVLNKASALDPESDYVQSLQASCLDMMNARVYSPELNVSVKLKAKCPNDIIVLGEPLKVYFSYCQEGDASTKVSDRGTPESPSANAVHNPYDWIGITRVLNQEEKRRVTSSHQNTSHQNMGKQANGIADSQRPLSEAANKSFQKPPDRQIHVNEGRVDFGDLSARALRDEDFEADAESIGPEEIAERLETPYEYDEFLVGWCFVPSQTNYGSVTFTDQPREAGVYRIRYFLHGTTLSAGDPVKILSKHVKAEIRAPNHHLCGNPLYVDYKLSYHALRCCHGAWISLWALGSKQSMWKKIAAATKLGLLRRREGEAQDTDEKSQDDKQSEDAGVVGRRVRSKRPPYNTERPIESLPISRHHQGRVCFPSHPMYPGLYEVRLFTGNRRLTESQVEEFHENKEGLHSQFGADSKSKWGTCVAVSSRILVTEPSPRYLLHPYTHLRRDYRVYISGACSDSILEREALFTFVAPRFRELCERRAVNTTFVDMRQGLPESDEVLRGNHLGELSSKPARGRRRSSILSFDDDQNTTATARRTSREVAQTLTSKCVEGLSKELQVEYFRWRVELGLKEIAECRPNAICIVGGRYGWQLPSLPARFFFRYPWLRQCNNEHVGRHLSKSNFLSYRKTELPEDPSTEVFHETASAFSDATIFSREKTSDVFAGASFLNKSFLAGYSVFYSDPTRNTRTIEDEKQLLPRTQNAELDKIALCSWSEAELNQIFVTPQYNPHSGDISLENTVETLLRLWLCSRSEFARLGNIDSGIECGLSSLASHRLLSLPKVGNHHILTSSVQWVLGKLEIPPITRLEARKLRDLDAPFSISVGSILVSMLPLSLRLKLFSSINRQRLLRETDRKDKPGDRKVSSREGSTAETMDESDAENVADFLQSSEHLVEGQYYNSMVYTRHPSLQLRGVSMNTFLSLSRSLDREVGDKAFVDLRNFIMKCTDQYRVGYTSIGNFCEWVLADCLNNFNFVFPSSDTPEAGELLGIGISAFTTTRRSFVILHEWFLECSMYLDSYLRDENHAAQSRYPQFVVGPTGGGKSTLLLHWISSINSLDDSNGEFLSTEEREANGYWKEKSFLGMPTSEPSDDLLYSISPEEYGIAWSRGIAMRDLSVDFSPYFKCLHTCSPVPHISVHKSDSVWNFVMYACIGVAGFPKSGTEIVNYISQEVCIAAAQVAYKMESEDENVVFMTELDDLFNNADPWYTVVKLETQYNLLMDSIVRGRPYEVIQSMFSELLEIASETLKITVVLDGCDVIVDKPAEWTTASLFPSRGSTKRNCQMKASATAFDYREFMHFDEEGEPLYENTSYDRVRDWYHSEEQLSQCPAQLWFVPSPLPQHVYFVLSMDEQCDSWKGAGLSAWGYSAIRVSPPPQRGILETLSFALRPKQNVRCPEWGGDADLEFQWLLQFPPPSLNVLDGILEDFNTRHKNRGGMMQTTVDDIRPELFTEGLDDFIDGAQLFATYYPVTPVNYARAQRHPILQCDNKTKSSLLDKAFTRAGINSKCRNVALNIVHASTMEVNNAGERRRKDSKKGTESETENPEIEFAWKMNELFARFSVEERKVILPEPPESLRESLIRILTARVPAEARVSEVTRQREAALRNPALLRCVLAALSMTESYFEALSLVYRVRADPRVEVAMCMILEGLERRYPIGIDVLCLLRCCHVGLSESELIDILGGHVLPQATFVGHSAEEVHEKPPEAQSAKKRDNDGAHTKDTRPGWLKPGNRSTHFSDIVEKLQNAVSEGGKSGSVYTRTPSEAMVAPPSHWAHFDAAAWSASRGVLLSSMVNVCRGLWCVDSPLVEQMVDRWILPRWSQRETYIQRIIAYFWIRPLGHRKMEELPRAFLQLLGWTDHKNKFQASARRASVVSETDDQRRSSSASATKDTSAQDDSTQNGKESKGKVVLKESVYYPDVDIASIGGCVFGQYSPRPPDEHDPNFLKLVKQGVSYSGISSNTMRPRFAELIELRLRHKNPWEALRNRDPYSLLIDHQRPEKVFIPNSARLASQLIYFLSSPNVMNLALSSQLYRVEYIRTLESTGLPASTIVDTFRSSWEHKFHIDEAPERPHYHMIRHSDYSVDDESPETEENQQVNEEQESSQRYVFARQWKELRTEGTEDLMKHGEIFLDLGDFQAAEEALECSFFIMTKVKSMYEDLAEFTSGVEHKLHELERTKTIERTPGEPLASGHRPYTLPEVLRSTLERFTATGTSAISLHQYQTPKQLMRALSKKKSAQKPSSSGSQMRRSPQFIDLENVCRVCGMLAALYAERIRSYYAFVNKLQIDAQDRRDSLAEYMQLDGGYLEQGGLQGGDPTNPIYLSSQKSGAAHEIRPTDTKTKVGNLIAFVKTFKKIVGHDHPLLDWCLKEAHAAMSASEESYTAA